MYAYVTCAMESGALHAQSATTSADHAQTRARLGRSYAYMIHRPYARTLVANQFLTAYEMNVSQTHVQ